MNDLLQNPEEGEDRARTELARWADRGVSRYTAALAALSLPSDAFNSTGFETGEQLAAEVRKLRSTLTAMTGGGGTGGGGGGGTGGGSDDGTDGPGDGDGGNTFPDLATEFIPGDDETPGAAFAVETRSRGGTAQLAGFGEYVPSVPPRYYLEKTLSGSVSGGVFSDAACTVPVVVPVAVSGTGGVFMEFNPTPPPERRVTANVSVRPETAGGWTFELVSWEQADPPGGAGLSVGFSHRLGVTPLSVGSPVTLDAAAVASLAPFGDIGIYYFGAPSASSVIPIIFGTEDCEESLTYAGSSTVDAATGVQTDGGTLTGKLYDPATGLLVDVSESGLASVDDALARIGAGCFGAAVNTALMHELPESGAGVQIGVSAAWRKLTTSSLKDELTSEDTEQDALDRLMAGAGGTWSAWALDAAAPYGGSAREARSVGSTFDYSEGEVRISLTGMPPGWDFFARAVVTRTDAAGESSIVATDMIVMTPDGFGDATTTIVLPVPESGDSYTVVKITFAR